jgi:hypothetical protein
VENLIDECPGCPSATLLKAACLFHELLEKRCDDVAWMNGVDSNVIFDRRI